MKDKYNEKNRGVDVFDQILSIAIIQRKTKKLYKKVMLKAYFLLFPSLSLKKNGLAKSKPTFTGRLADNLNFHYCIKIGCKDNHISRHGQIIARKYRFFQFLLGD